MELSRKPSRKNINVTKFREEKFCSYTEEPEKYSSFPFSGFYRHKQWYLNIPLLLLNRKTQKNMKKKIVQIKNEKIQVKTKSVMAFPKK